MTNLHALVPGEAEKLGITTHVWAIDGGKPASTTAGVHVRERTAFTGLA